MPVQHTLRQTGRLWVIDSICYQFCFRFWLCGWWTSYSKGCSADSNANKATYYLLSYNPLYIRSIVCCINMSFKQARQMYEERNLPSFLSQQNIHKLGQHCCITCEDSYYCLDRLTEINLMQSTSSLSESWHSFPLECKEPNQQDIQRSDVNDSQIGLYHSCNLLKLLVGCPCQ